MPGPRRPWLIALCLSVAVHLCVLAGGSGLWPQRLDPPESHFDARLTTAPSEPRRVRAVRPTQPTPATPDSPAVAVEAAAPEPEPEAPPPAPPKAPTPASSEAVQASAPLPAPLASDTFPRRARLAFRITLGDRGTLIGHAVQTWQSDGGRYRIDTRSTSAGLVALFKNVTLAQSSEGVIGEGGLKPALFRAERDGRVTEEAVFDWQAGQLTLKSGERSREVGLVPGAQDVLSLFYQTALTYRGDETIATQVATGKSFNTYQLKRVGEAWLPTRLGRLATVHLTRQVAAGEDGVEIWLGRDVSWLPVRIRFSDRKGEVYDQLIEEIEIEGAAVRVPAAGQGGAELVAQDPGEGGW